MPPILECVPNFSEGRDQAVLAKIRAAIESVEGVTFLDIDPGAGTNRTVMTFVGAPEPVVEAAVRAGRVSAELIDMRRHSGAHPRFGAMDVCPLIPVRDISMEETAEWARRLGKRLAEEVGLTIYLYERAASRPARKNLADVRAGEYEGLAEKLAKPDWQPDFGPATLQPKTGATAVGARDFLLAYNVNLNTTSVKLANEVAFDLRESGRIKKGADGQPLKDSNGESLRTPGLLTGVKAIGWFIEEYGIAQVSMNLTDLCATPLHRAFDEAAGRAQAYGMRATGSEVVGLLPLKSLLEAGRHYLAKQGRSTGVSEAELIKIAVKSMGLDELAPFDPAQKVIDYRLEAGQKTKLIGLTVRGFAEEVASESLAPGGGSVSANLGAMGAALAAMVANLSANKKGWEGRAAEFSRLAEQGQVLLAKLLQAIDDDTQAFKAILTAGRLPKATPEEQAARSAAQAKAQELAIDVPLSVMRLAVETLELLSKVAEVGNPASITDVGVGALAAHAAVRGARLNVDVNTRDRTDAAQIERYSIACSALSNRAGALEASILERVKRVLAGA
jgi:glutamate formiminotransferase / formiminotetrahydrofolate cyclodeaminase